MMGDSRTIGNAWPGILAAKASFDVTDASDPANQNTVAAWSSGIAARLAQIPVGVSPVYFLINIGAHDLIYGLPDEATWKANFTAALDAINTAHPDAKVYLMKSWQQGDDAEANTMAGWLDAVIASRSTFTFAGPDERVWMKGSDDGATMGTLHYTTAGQFECARQWLQVLN